MIDMDTTFPENDKEHKVLNIVDACKIFLPDFSCKLVTDYNSLVMGSFFYSFYFCEYLFSSMNKIL